jgi:hypothetical protein
LQYYKTTKDYGTMEYQKQFHPKNTNLKTKKKTERIENEIYQPVKLK